MLLQVSPTNAKTIHHSRSEVLDQDVHAVDQAQAEIEAFRLFQVDGDAPVHLDVLDGVGPVEYVVGILIVALLAKAAYRTSRRAFRRA